MSVETVAGVRGLAHRYGRVVALDDVSLEVPARRMVGVIGPDGVGKSTLLAILAGVREIQTGAVRVFGDDMRDRRARFQNCARVAYMPQGLGRNLYPTLTVFENIDFFGRLFGQKADERRARMDELLRATGLDPFEDRPAGKLSGGMKQKLSLCCSLMHDPELLILDEPTTGVDPLSRRQFWDLIGSMRARRPQMSVIVATAYMDEAARFDWLAAMDDGKVIATGAPAEIMARAHEASLENAFVALLPEEKRALHKTVELRPRVERPGEAPAIVAEGLTRRFGDFVAVDHVSFRIARGEIFGFLGSNGCGKSTTMKMLTGLLPASEGTASLFGQPIGSDDMELRRNVGYMSQSFSLYAELTVRQNLELHAHLYHLAPEEIGPRIEKLLERFDLRREVDARPESLPLGVKQRLQLAVAVLHGPAMLILDEPTSGVDPIARDNFWRELIRLSRDEGVTIFVSTHFMNEAERCDRISLMHAGRVLVVGTPREIVAERGARDLEDAFIGYLEDAEAKTTDEAPPTPAPTHEGAPAKARRFDPRRLWAYARRETIELLRDPIRLAFALAGPLLLMIAFGYGISFDVDNLRYAVFDQDRSPESRQLLESFSGSRYFTEEKPIASVGEMDDRLRRGEVTLVVEIPPGFGRDLQNQRTPEVIVVIDGAMPFRGETARSYVSALALEYAQRRTIEAVGPNAAAATTINVETRFRYNQAFKSVNAMVPSIIVLMLTMIPAIMSAVAVVREKETGSIANFRATPVSRFEFLFGKQLPYVAVALTSFFLLVALARLVFDVSVKGSFLTLLPATVLYVFATTGFGQLVSTFTKTQVAAVFATAILCVIPAVNFSGLMTPVASLSGGARFIGLTFPAAWYQPVSVGVFTKGLGFSELWPSIVVLGLFALFYLAAAQLLLKKQEA